jgi:succinylglutamate desuccinylase
MFPGSIVKIEGSNPGKTLAVFAGVHGNERVGVLAIRSILENLEIEKGIVYFVFANPPAIEKDVRLVNKNLNRLFSRDVQGGEYEFARAHELMDILDDCDALLDLHSYNSLEGVPFVIAEKNAEDFTNLLDVEIVTEGFGDIGHGTDNYMYQQGKVSVCLECGTSNKFQEFTPFAINAIKQFLHFYGASIEMPIHVKRAQSRIRVKKLITKKTQSFSFSKSFRDFEELPAGIPYIYDGEVIVVANPGEVIIFPRPDVSIGEETCIIGEYIT